MTPAIDSTPTAKLYSSQLQNLLSQRSSIQKQLRDNKLDRYDEQAGYDRTSLSLKLAESGEAMGLYVKGNIHTHKGYFKTDLVKAEYYLTKAAEQGFDVAQKKLGDSYADGRDGFVRDPDKAVFWLIEAAESTRIGRRGEWDDELAFRYATGNSIPKSLTNAIYWKVLRPLEGLTLKDLLAECLLLNGNESKLELIKKIIASLGVFTGVLYLAFTNTIYLLFLISIYFFQDLSAYSRKNRYILIENIRKHQTEFL